MTIGLEALGLMALRRLDPERAHAIALMALRRGFAPRVAAPTAPGLATRIFGLDLPTPVGAAAGFDKNAVAPDAILSRGFGFMEVGAVTPLPQRGNPRPRLFRLNEDQAAINRFGFNNDGLDLIARRLGARTEPVDRVWANIGANKDAADRVEDFVTVLRGLHGRVGAATINISSPNTERLRDLQGCAALDALLARVIAARDALAAEDGRRTPLLLKVSPDLDEREIAEIAEVALERGIDGIVATNTTVGGRDALRSPARMEAGGLSGAPLFERSTAVLAAFAGRLNGRIPLVGVGGISSAEQAYAKIRAGASVVQVYTGMIYGGVSLGARIADGLAELARRDGFASVAEAVGTGLSPKAAASR